MEDRKEGKRYSFTLFYHNPYGLVVRFLVPCSAVRLIPLDLVFT